MKESIFTFGESNALVGIRTHPHRGGKAKNRPSILILGAGITHRVGPNRLNVKIARNLAYSGYQVLRFDFSGIGDSPFDTGDRLFEERAVMETRMAMNALQSRANVDRFILMGICSGGGIAFRTACSDTRVKGAVLINPIWHLDGPDPGRNRRGRTLARFRNLLRNSLVCCLKKEYWDKVFALDPDFYELAKNEIIGFIYKNRSSVLRQTEPARKTVDDKFSELMDRKVKLFHIYSERDIGLDYLKIFLKDRFNQMEKAGRVSVIKGANHTFTPLWSQEKLFKTIHAFITNAEW